MNIMKLIKGITPPILLDIYRSHKLRVHRKYTWNGIYPHYRDVPITGESYYDSDMAANGTLRKTKNLLTTSKQYGTIPTGVTDEYTLLPLVASLVCADSGTVRILDFGGGLGVAYIHLVSSIAKCCTVDYHIVEIKKMCEVRGGVLFKNDDRIQFHTSLPDLSEIDIVYMNSVLQYIEDYAGLLKALCAYQARYFLFVKLSASDIPTYATGQKNMPLPIPYWFVNVNEIIKIMSESGYLLIFKGALEREYNQDNFPEEYRVGCACNLLFSRE
jgi:putative methyltransferase (TIGR04325 family)